MAKGDLKTVLLNGIQIGEYLSTGTDEGDHAAALQVLKDKGVYKPASRVQAMYNQAVAFAGASKDLYERHLTKSPFNGHAVAPFVVNATLSIELYLKTLLASAGAAVPKRHELVNLFDALPDRLRALVNEATPRIAPLRGVSPTIDFRTSLAHVNTAFERWRYIYEDASMAAVQVPEVIFLMHVLHATCSAELHGKSDSEAARQPDKA